MKIAVSSSGKDLNSQIDPRFGRCACFVIVDPDDMSYEAFDNENIGLSGGAGIQSASFISSKGAIAVLTGNCGPNAIKVFSAEGIEVYTGQTGTVQEAIERYKEGSLRPSTKATVAEKSGVRATGNSEAFQSQGSSRCMGGSGRGMGMGGGRGMGGGGGMGMGGGRGMGMGGGTGIQGTGMENSAAAREKDLTELKKQAEDLQRQMEKIQTKIKNLE